MDASPFDRREPEPPSLLQRILGRSPPENALVELVNLLAERSPSDFPGPDEVQAIGRRYGVKLTERFGEELEGLYRTFVLHCLEDRRLSTEESAAAGRLAEALGLSAPRCAVIQRQVARTVYLRSVEEVLADGEVDPGERAFLRELQRGLGISADDAENMLDVRRQQEELSARSRTPPPRPRRAPPTQR